MTELMNPKAEFSDRYTDIDDAWIELEEEIESEEEEINGPFDPTRIRVDTRPMTIDLVLSRIQYDELDLAPDFQRHAGIWTNAAKSRLIESILIRIPLPAFYMDATNDDKWLVIDGLQRLTTLKQFVIDKELRLSKLEYLKEHQGKNYDELPRNFQRRILETVITIYLIEKGTPPAVKFNIFRRINTGGLPLSPQELRHAMNQGKATKFLARLAEYPEFKRATGISNSRTKRMDDQEFILGFLAFTITPYTNYHEFESRDVFLSTTMDLVNRMPDLEIEDVDRKFKQAMIAAFELFGENAFHKISRKNPSKKYPINKALFEVWSVNLGQLSSQRLEIVKKQKSKMINNFIDLIDTDENFLTSISQAARKVEYGFSTIEKLIEEVLL